MKIVIQYGNKEVLVVSHHASKSNQLSVHQRAVPGLAEYFSHAYPDFVLFVRFVPTHELYKYELEREGYGVFTAEGNNLALCPTLEDACEWVRIEQCEPMLMH